MGEREERIRIAEQQIQDIRRRISEGEDTPALHICLHLNEIVLESWRDAPPAVRVKRKPYFLKKGSYHRANEFNSNANWG